MSWRMSVTKKASELQEGEWVEYRPEHTDQYTIQFIKEYGQLQVYMYHDLNPSDGVNVYLDAATLDRWQQEIIDNKGVETDRFIKG